MSLSDFVDLTITAETAVVSAQGFGTPLIAAYHTNWPERTRVYTSLSGLTSDGFATTDPVYKIAANILGQTSGVRRFKVGRRALPYTQSFTLTPTDTTEGLVYSVIIGTETASYTVVAADTVADITAGLTASITGLTAAVTPTDNTTDVSVLADNAGDLFRVAAQTTKLEVKMTTADPGIATDLAAIRLEDSDWYGLLLDSQGQAEVVAAAAWAQAEVVLFGASTPDADYKSSATTDIAGVLNAASYTRTFTAFHSDTDEHLAAAWMSGRFRSRAGTSTWKFKNFQGITADTLTATEKTNILNKKGNYYEQCPGVIGGRTTEGWVASGAFIDAIRFQDHLTARIREGLAETFFTAAKIPFTDKGGEVIKGALLGVLTREVNAGALSSDPFPEVVLPKVADISAVDKAARCFTGISFSATSSSAIHKVVITGTLAA